MPCVDILPLDPGRKSHLSNPLPQLLQTPSGLAIVEIQGTIHIPAPPGTDTLSTDPSRQTSGETLAGRLIFPKFSPEGPSEDQSWMKRVYLYVGRHQRLTGEVTKLPRPLGVLRKSSDHDGDELEISEVIRYKIVFSQRPEPVGDE